MALPFGFNPAAARAKMADQSVTDITEARRRLAMQRSGAMDPNAFVKQPGPQLPTPQMRNTAGQFGVAAQGADQRQQSIYADMERARQQGLMPQGAQIPQQGQPQPGIGSFLGALGAQGQPQVGTQIGQSQGGIQRSTAGMRAQDYFRRALQPGSGVIVNGQIQQARDPREVENERQKLMADSIEADRQNLLRGVQSGQLTRERAQVQYDQLLKNAQSQFATSGLDTVPAMLQPGEAVIPAQQTAALSRAGLLDNVTGIPQQQLYAQNMAQQRLALAGQALHFAAGGVVPQTGLAPTPTTATAQGPQPAVTPIPEPGPPPPAPAPYQADFGQLATQINAFGPSGGLTDQLIAQRRAQESQRLANIERARLSELGAAAASSGALLGGDVKGLAAQIAQQRIQAEAEMGTNLAIEQSQQQQDLYKTRLGVAAGLAGQREQQAYSAQENEALRKWQTGERLSTQEFQTVQNALQRQFQTSERVGTQAFSAEEAQKQRTFAGDESSKDRLTQVALAEKNIEAQRTNLLTQIEAARAEGDADRVNRLTLQSNDLDQQRNQLRQQNDQFLASIGLDRDRFDAANRQFDLTRGDQVNQFAATLGQRQTEFDRTFSQHEQEFLAQFTGEITDPRTGEKITGLGAKELAQRLEIAQMSDATARYVEDLKAKVDREKIDAATPSELASGIKIIGDLMSVPGIGPILGGALTKGLGALGISLPGLSTTATPGTPAATGAGLAPVLGVAAGAALAYQGVKTLDAALKDGSTPKMALAGLELAGPMGAAAAAIAHAAGVGPSKERIRRDAFTKVLDDTLGKVSGQNGVPPPDSGWWQPEVRAEIAKNMATLVSNDWETGQQSVDWKRMADLGLAAAVQRRKPDGSTEFGGWILLDDPESLALAKAGQPPTYEVPADKWSGIFSHVRKNGPTLSSLKSSGGISKYPEMAQEPGASASVSQRVAQKRQEVAA